MKLQVVGVVLVVLFAGSTLEGEARITPPEQECLVSNDAKNKVNAQGPDEYRETKSKLNTQPHTDAPQFKSQQVSGKINQPQEGDVWWWITAVSGWIVALITFFLMHRQNQAAWVEANAAREQLRLSKIAHLSFGDWTLRDFLPNTQATLSCTIYNTGYPALLTGYCLRPVAKTQRPPIPDYRNLPMTPVARIPVNPGVPFTYEFSLDPLPLDIHEKLNGKVGVLYIPVCFTYEDGLREGNEHVRHLIGLVLRYDAQHGRLTQIDDPGYTYNP